MGKELSKSRRRLTDEGQMLLKGRQGVIHVPPRLASHVEAHPGCSSVSKPLHAELIGPPPNCCPICFGLRDCHQPSDADNLQKALLHVHDTFGSVPSLLLGRHWSTHGGMQVSKQAALLGWGAVCWVNLRHSCMTSVDCADAESESAADAGPFAEASAITKHSNMSCGKREVSGTGD